MAIFLIVGAILIWIADKFIKHQEKIFNTGFTALVIFFVMLGVYGLSGVLMNNDVDEVEFYQMSNYQIEGEVMDILYQYHVQKYPDGAMSYDPEPSISLVLYYPEAHNDVLIKELVSRYYDNVEKIKITSYRINDYKMIRQWLLNFNLW